MLKGLGDMANIMKLQKEFKNTQKAIKKAKLEGQNQDGTVKAVVTGEYSLTDLKIDKSLAETGDSKKIEREVMAAVNSAVEEVRNFSAAEMNKLTGGMGPELMNMLGG